MTINNRSLGGQPNLPYTDYRTYAGTDAFFELTFLDRNQSLVVPTALTYRVDDMSNAVPMIPPTAVDPLTLASTYELQLTGAQMQMTNTAQGSQICQVYLTATLPDGTTANQVGILELVAVQVPN